MQQGVQMDATCNIQQLMLGVVGQQCCVRLHAAQVVLLLNQAEEMFLSSFCKKKMHSSMHHPLTFISNFKT